MIKPVIRQTWEEELDHCVSPSSNEQPGSRCRLPTAAQPQMKPLRLFSPFFDLRGKQEERQLASLSALNPLLVASKPISVEKL